jgi:hypothetical protein
MLWILLDALSVLYLPAMNVSWNGHVMPIPSNTRARTTLNGNWTSVGAIHSGPRVPAVFCPLYGWSNTKMIGRKIK